MRQLLTRRTAEHTHTRTHKDTQWRRRFGMIRHALASDGKKRRTLHHTKSQGRGAGKAGIPWDVAVYIGLD